MRGWQSDISSIRKYSDLPKAAREYVERIEELVGVPIHYIGIGPGRDAFLYKWFWNFFSSYWQNHVFQIVGKPISLFLNWYNCWCLVQCTQLLDKRAKSHARIYSLCTHHMLLTVWHSLIYHHGQESFMFLNELNALNIDYDKHRFKIYISISPLRHLSCYMYYLYRLKGSFVHDQLLWGHTFSAV